MDLDGVDVEGFALVEAEVGLDEDEVDTDVVTGGFSLLLSVVCALELVVAGGVGESVEHSVEADELSVDEEVGEAVEEVEEDGETVVRFLQPAWAG